MEILFRKFNSGLLLFDSLDWGTGVAAIASGEVVVIHSPLDA